ncbi:MAG: phosphatidate cytidylyltransferase [Spirochaetales bacterium]|nr:phosphatidate cytidylyltransferase [Spirochaetales bacterium]
MNNLIRRISLALFSIPVLLILIFITPHYSHLFLNLVIAVLSILGALETRNLFLKRNTHLNKTLTIILALVFPVLNILVVMELIPSNWILPVFLFFISLLITAIALTRNKDSISTVLDRLPAYCFIMLFPGFFMSFLIRFNMLEQTSLLLLIFLTFVFGNDTFAYFSGMMFGKGNRGIFPVSPNKSAAGLIGGIVTAGLAGWIYFRFFPKLFNNSPISAILIGVCIAFTSVIGDLLESAMKRSADEKDSGTIMRGRGGVLDTIDSVLFSAPLFYFLMYQLQSLNG